MTPRRSIFDRAIQYVRPRLVSAFAPPPLPIAPDLWSLERQLRMPPGLRLPTRSTIIRLASGGLLVVSPPAVEAGGLDSLDAIGAVEEILVPNSFHYLNAAGFLARYPRATLRLAPGLRQRIAGLPNGDELTVAAPDAWGAEVEHLLLGPTRGISEVAIYHRPSATLVLTDVAFHMTRFERRWERAAWRLSGVPVGFGPSRTGRLFLLNDRAAAAAFVGRVLAWPFQRILVAHGEPLEQDARDVFRRAFAAYLG